MVVVLFLFWSGAGAVVSLFGGDEAATWLLRQVWPPAEHFTVTWWGFALFVGVVAPIVQWSISETPSKPKAPHPSLIASDAKDHWVGELRSGKYKQG